MRFLLIAMLTLLINGCSYFKPLASISPVKKEFLSCTTDSRILCKAGAEKNAERVSEQLDSDITKIEKIHGKKFTKPVTVHICDTTECFDHYTGYGQGIKAGVSDNGLFLSPKAFEDNYCNLFLMHELSHLHLFQQISLIDAYFIPQWFHDGLATYASQGGGAAEISDQDAKQFLKDHKSIEPVTNTLFSTQRWPITYTPSSDKKFQQQMNYKQSALFVAYLDSDGLLQKLLRALENGESFSGSFKDIYGMTVDKKWIIFLESIKS